MTFMLEISQPEPLNVHKKDENKNLHVSCVSVVKKKNQNVIFECEEKSRLYILKKLNNHRKEKYFFARKKK